MILRNVSKERISAMDGDVLFTSHSIKEMRKKDRTRKEYINDPLFKI